MSRGEDQFWPNGDEMYNVGGAWICDRCGFEVAPNNSMVEPFGDGQHICSDCMLSEIFEQNHPRHGETVSDTTFRKKDGKTVVVRFSEKRTRKTIPQGIRVEVLSVGECAKCKSREDLQVDHIFPVSKGGNNDPVNLQSLCGACNRKKSAKIELEQ